MAGGAIALNLVPGMASSPFDRHYLDDGTEDLARLCYNENPFGPSKIAREAIAAAMPIAHQYPFEYISDFMEKLAASHDLIPENIVVCGGSVEGLRAAGMAFCKPGGELISPSPTYLSMMTYVANLGTKVVYVPVDKNLDHDLAEMENKINENTNLVFICNPNNPTGTIIPDNKLRAFISRVSKKVPVFVDEAYFDYVDDAQYSSVVDLVKQGENIIVSRTFSKVYGLAGMRVGYLMAKPELAASIRDRIQASANIFAVKAAEASMDDRAFYKYSQDVNNEGRQMIAQACDKLGLKYVKPNTNFVFFQAGIDVKTMNDRMKAKNILIGRPFPPLTDWCRVSTGKLEDVERFVKALPEVL